MSKIINTRHGNCGFLYTIKNLLFTPYRQLRTELNLYLEVICYISRREFLRDILYNNIAIIAIQRSKINFVDNFGDFSHTVE